LIGKKVEIFFVIMLIFLVISGSISHSKSSTSIDVTIAFKQLPTFDNFFSKNQNDEVLKEILSKKSETGFLGIEYTGWTPPDPIIAAGLDHLVVMTNGGIAFFEKDGTKIFQDEIEDSYGFWGEVGASNFVFDPEVIYDPYEDRFMAIASERGPGSKSYFLLAISDDANPDGSWHKYRMDVTSLGGGGDIDSPNIAVDSQAIYLTADFFTGGQKYLIYILEKEPFLSGSIGTTKNLLITGSQSYGIPVTYGESPAMYMIEHFESPSNSKVRLHAITDSLGSPQLVYYDLTVPAYTPPEFAPSKGTGSRITTFDSRFWSCVWRDSSLWATHHQGSERVKARWYQIKTNDWPETGVPELIQSGDIDPGPDIRTFFTAIAPDGYGNAQMVFARSSPDEYISISKCGRLASDPLGTMRKVTFIKNSSSPYNGSRWGDYSGISCDPSDNYTFWMHGEYTPGDDIWNTWISSCTAPNQPPDKPMIIGPTYGKSSTEISFCIEVFDQNSDDIYCHWDWGDGTYSEWLGPFNSGEQVCVSNSWPNDKTYEIRVKLKDIYAEGEWSESHYITIESEPPSFVIAKPENGIYYQNNKLISFPIPIIIGSIDVEINAFDENSGISHIDIFIDDNFKCKITQEPYVWIWTEKSFFRHELKIVVYDNAGNDNTKNLIVWKFL
jgi:hypothetical protein